MKLTKTDILILLCVLAVGVIGYIIGCGNSKNEKQTLRTSIDQYADSLYNTRHYYDSLLKESNKIIGSKTDSIIIEKRLQNITYKNYVTTYSNIPTSDNDREYDSTRRVWQQQIREGFLFDK